MGCVKSIDTTAKMHAKPFILKDFPKGIFIAYQTAHSYTSQKHQGLSTRDIMESKFNSISIMVLERLSRGLMDDMVL